MAARPGVGKTALALNIAKNITQEETINSNR
ncbi:DnaB-like helicase C-terminal domain-containing protein [Mycoplasmopsis cynos]|nr:DnaB-like helicase C-terminal domain-containing protein [Mycoplasmopsis cynos]UWV83369.1 DnaB-like helicase C-terminal domain-containing protein [Mycoplasmopsis cynos]